MNDENVLTSPAIQKFHWETIKDTVWNTFLHHECQLWSKSEQKVFHKSFSSHFAPSLLMEHKRGRWKSAIKINKRKEWAEKVKGKHKKERGGAARHCLWQLISDRSYCVESVWEAGEGRRRSWLYDLHLVCKDIHLINLTVTLLQYFPTAVPLSSNRHTHRWRAVVFSRG